MRRLPQASIGFEDLRDPEAIANWPLTLGRDGARTPIPWTANGAYAGFSEGRPWLPIPPEHRALAVDLQERDPGSQLALTRRLIALRNRHAALRMGSLRVIEASPTVLIIDRTTGDECLLCLFNFGGTPHIVEPPPTGNWRVLESVGGAAPWSLPSLSGVVVKR